MWAGASVTALLGASAAHAARRDLVDLVSFLLVAAVITGEHLAGRRLHEPSAPTRWAPSQVLWLVVLAAVLGSLAGPPPHAAWQARLLVLMIGAGALAVLLTHPVARRHPRAVPHGWVAWAVVAVLVCLWELSGFLSQPDPLTDNPDHPTLSTLVDPLLASPETRALAVAVWVLVGVWLLRAAVSAGRAVAGGDDPATETGPATEPSGP